MLKESRKGRLLMDSKDLDRLNEGSYQFGLKCGKWLKKNPKISIVMLAILSLFVIYKLLKL